MHFGLIEHFSLSVGKQKVKGYRGESEENTQMKWNLVPLSMLFV